MFFNLTYPNFNFAHKFDEKPKPNDEFENHFHMIYEILFFVRGDAEFIIENKRFVLNSGDLLFISPGKHHNVNVNPNVPYERYVVKFPEYVVPEQLLPLVKSKSGSYTTLNTPIPALFERFDSEVEQYKGVDTEGLLSCNLKEILYYACSKESKSHDFVVFKENMIDVLDYINVNLAGELSLEQLSEHFHYSKSYLCKEFLQCMNVPIMQYIRTKRILLADALLKNGVKPVQAYEQCGFWDYSTFFRAYKSLMGKPPSAKL